MNPVFDLTAVGLLVVVTAVLGFAGIRTSRTRSDFFVASRSVGSVWNASAISGEYLSAGTFLGLAGLVLLSGAEGFWFPIGYAAGYLLVLLFVAAPLRRSGAYTIPDFVEARLESRTVRRVTSIVVLVIGWLYIVPQLHGAALALGVVADVPPWTGGVVVAVLVAAIVAAGGMRAITAVQAFQYWLKLTALLVPAVFLLAALSGGGREIDPVQVFPVESGPGALDVYATRRCCWPCCWARSACRMCSCGSTPAPTGRRRGARRWSSSCSSGRSTRCRRPWGSSLASSPPISRSPGWRTRSCSPCPRACSRGSSGSCSRPCSSRARSRRSWRPRRGSSSRSPGW